VQRDVWVHKNRVVLCKIQTEKPPTTLQTKPSLPMYVWSMNSNYHLLDRIIFFSFIYKHIHRFLPYENAKSGRRERELGFEKNEISSSEPPSQKCLGWDGKYISSTDLKMENNNKNIGGPKKRENQNNNNKKWSAWSRLRFFLFFLLFAFLSVVDVVKSIELALLLWLETRNANELAFGIPFGDIIEK
jgi:hypothetical protein